LSVTDELTAEPLDLVDDHGQPEGVEAQLGEVTVVSPQLPLGVEALAVQQATDWNFEGRVKLVGYSVGRWTVKTGEILPVNLFWQSLAADLPDLICFVQLQDDQGRALALTERPPVYPTPAWTTGTLLRDLHRLRLPAEVPPGRYRLAAGVLIKHDCASVTAIRSFWARSRSKAGPMSLMRRSLNSPPMPTLPGWLDSLAMI
jgi:hypothetical protein